MTMSQMGWAAGCLRLAAQLYKRHPFIALLKDDLVSFDTAPKSPIWTPRNGTPWPLDGMSQKYRLVGRLHVGRQGPRGVAYDGVLTTPHLEAARWATRRQRMAKRRAE